MAFSKESLLLALIRNNLSNWSIAHNLRNWAFEEDSWNSQVVVVVVVSVRNKDDGTPYLLIWILFFTFSIANPCRINQIQKYINTMTVSLSLMPIAIVDFKAKHDVSQNIGIYLPMFLHLLPTLEKRNNFWSLASMCDR